MTLWEHDGDDGGGHKIAIRRAQLDESEMDIAPMIDCTFLLLIFFIVCARIQQNAAVNLPQAHNGVVLAANEAVILTVTSGNATTAVVYKGDGAVAANEISNADPVAQEQEISRYVEAAMLGEQKTSILVKAERAVKHREVSRVIKAATQGIDIQKVHVAVQQSGG